MSSEAASAQREIGCHIDLISGSQMVIAAQKIIEDALKSGLKG